MAGKDSTKAKKTKRKTRRGGIPHGFYASEKERFELSRRLSRPTPLAGAPLRPLEYFSVSSERQYGGRRGFVITPCPIIILPRSLFVKGRGRKNKKIANPASAPLTFPGKWDTIDTIPSCAQRAFPAPAESSRKAWNTMDTKRKTELQEIARQIRAGLIDAVY